MGVRVSASRHGGVVRARRWGPLVGALLALAALSATPALSKPTRVVSMRSCADQLLLLLADRAIASISYLAVDANASAMAERPRAWISTMASPRKSYRSNRTSYWPVPSPPDRPSFSCDGWSTASWSFRSHPPSTISAPTYGRLPRRSENANEASPSSPRSIEIWHRRRTRRFPNPVAALYWANGYSSGRGTLADVVARAAGFRNLASELGLAGTAQIPLETLLASKPDVLIVGRQRGGAAMAHEHLRHPAFRKAFADHPTVTFPNRLWVCGTPFVAEAVNRLRALRDGGSAVRQSGGER